MIYYDYYLEDFRTNFSAIVFYSSLLNRFYGCHPSDELFTLKFLESPTIISGASVLSPKHILSLSCTSKSLPEPVDFDERSILIFKAKFAHLSVIFCQKHGVKFSSIIR